MIIEEDKCFICGKEDLDLIPISYKYGHFDSEPETYACVECIDKKEEAKD